MGEKLPLPIGIESYKELIKKSYYYIDKTLLIKELIDKKGKVNLFTRPRRFGKTLALSTIRTYFEMEIDFSGNIIDNSHYFEGKKILQAGEKYIHYMGQFPVISLSLKSAKQPTFDIAYKVLIDEISSEFKRHRYVLLSDKLLEDERKRFEAIMLQKAAPAEYTTALKFLSDCLKIYHQKDVIILIDEYDVPLENAHFRNFYDDMISFIRSLFESALKTNDSLEFAVITGCLRISKESIFTGLNNLKMVSILTPGYAQYFGFTPAETEAMLDYYDLSVSRKEVQHWYDGYLFGEIEIYNPWSLINYVEDAISSSNYLPRPYWSNTSSNSIVKELIEKSDSTVKKEVENLIAGQTIEKPIHEEITYDDIYKTQDNLWNFLFFTGYLKMNGMRLRDNTLYLTLTIPNEEIRYIYQYTIREWFEQQIRVMDLQLLYESILARDSLTFETFIKTQLRQSISYFDSSESFYHGFMLGLMRPLQNYEIKSNFESGEGRSDLMLIPLDELQPAVIMEFKHVKRFSEMEAGCKEALYQIDDKHYDAELVEEGYETIYKYGICFCKKSCKVEINTAAAN